MLEGYSTNYEIGLVTDLPAEIDELGLVQSLAVIF